MQKPGQVKRWQGLEKLGGHVLAKRTPPVMFLFDSFSKSVRFVSE